MSGIRFAPSVIEQWPIGKLLPYANNPRAHDSDQVARIAASIARFGWVVPVLVDERGVVVAGHGRLLAARQLGLTDIPVIRLTHLSDGEARALRIADNRLAELSTWNDEALAAELARLGEDGLDLSLTGFDDAEIDRLLAGLNNGDAAAENENDIPDAPPEPVTRTGDLWLLGDHRLLCGDAIRPADVDRVLGGALADMCVTDLPYNVGYEGRGSTRENRTAIRNDKMGEEAFAAFLKAACAPILSVTEGAIYIAMSSSQLHALKAAFEQAGGHWSTFIIWAKDHFTLGRSDYQRAYEPLLYGWRQGADRFWCGARDQGDVWFVKRPRSNDLHPTMKPVELFERAIRNSSKSRDIILDPFAGSGTTVIAAEKLGRQARLIEIDPVFCDVIVERWHRFSGRDAVLASDHRSFADVAAERS